MRDEKIRVKFPLAFKIVLGLIIIIIGAIVGIYFYKKVNVEQIVTDESQIYDIVIKNAAKYKTKITFESTFSPDNIDYNMIFHGILDEDPYIGAELYAYSYECDILSNGNYKTTITLRNPAWHRYVLTKWRVKQIASHLRDLDDYEAVKAVHDYLVLINEYSYTVCGAFNGLYVGKCACNGYAYSFYLIMKELDIPVTCEYSSNHVWNMVKVDGEWYNIDVTWDDLGGKNVGYDYFLKSDNDWAGHEHGGATALTSHEVTGKSPLENKKLIPNYRIIMYIIAAVVFIIIIGIGVLLDKRYKHKKLLELYKDELDEVRKR